MAHPPASNKVVGVGMYVTNLGAASLQKISDENSSKMSQVGMDNFFGHYPAGGSHR